MPATAGAQPASSPAATADCPLDGRLAGVWEAENGSTMVRFYRVDDGTPRYAFAVDGRLDLVAPIVECSLAGVVICSFGQAHSLDIQIMAGRQDGGAADGDRLSVHHRRMDERTTYRRVAGVPDLFAPRPLEIPAAVAVSDERVATVREELARRLQQDQAVRQQPLDPTEMMRADADNTAYLVALVGELGWIAPELFGDDAALAAFLIVQHSGHLPLMMGALPHVRAAGQLEDYALLYDRLEIRQGGKQRYGSQLGWAEDGAMGLLPIETLEGIDEIRATVDLPPLAEYLAHFDLTAPRILECDGPGPE